MNYRILLFFIQSPLLYSSFHFPSVCSEILCCIYNAWFNKARWSRGEAIPVGALLLMADRLAWELGINPQADKKILNW